MPHMFYFSKRHKCIFQMLNFFIECNPISQMKFFHRFVGHFNVHYSFIFFHTTNNCRFSLNVIFKIASKFTKSIAFKEVYTALMCIRVRHIFFRLQGIKVYFGTLSLKFQKARTKIEVVLSALVAVSV